MHPPHVPIGIIGRLIRWAKDFAAMPARVRELYGQIEAATDARHKCPSCGQGRIGDLKTSREQWATWLIGTCNECQMRWKLTDDAKTIHGPG
jgi:predicted RNA-binding Zn-ribbon protein involved in translation (DUF1610 family)